MDTPPSILIVDDEPDNFDVIETFLKDEGYQLHYAPNGQKALDQLASFQPDVILLDVMMPGMNGIQVCQTIKAKLEWQMIPIVMVTALNTKEDLARGLASGASDFISKPVNSTELKARVRSMLKIKKQYDDLQTLLQQREDMVNMIVHDLRNPLTSILLSTDILRFPNLTVENQRKKIDQIAIAGHQLQTLIDSLLLMAKLESGKMVLNRTEIDLYTPCLSAVEDFEPIAAQKNVRLVSQLTEAKGVINVDLAVFRRILDNLLSNAIKFTPPNSEVNISVSYLESGGAKIQVADAGPGVREEVRKSIFEKYEIGTLMPDIPQIGLGLAFCKMAIEAHGGAISVAENQPRGAIFTLSLPGSN